MDFVVLDAGEAEAEADVDLSWFLPVLPLTLQHLQPKQSHQPLFLPLNEIN